MNKFMNQTNTYMGAEDGLRAYINGVYTKMAAGLGITALTAYLGYQNIIHGGFLYKMLLSGSRLVTLVMFFVQIGIVINLSRELFSMSASRAKGMFYLYSFITGVTFSVLPITFGATTVFQAFLYSAVMFGSCAVIGYTTNRDLSKLSGILMGGLIALIIASVLGMFIPALGNSLGIAYIGVILFCAITAWDMQRIKSMYYQSSGMDSSENLAVLGALSLYLDFINIFLYVLRIMGAGSRD